MGLICEYDLRTGGPIVPYPPNWENGRTNRGFIDLRGNPDLASTIAEATPSTALKNLLVKVANPNSSVFTIGCDLSSHIIASKRQKHAATGYVQYANKDYKDTSPQDYQKQARAIEQIRERIVR